MRREFTIALIALLPVSFGAAQQPTPPSDPTAPAQANEAPDTRTGLYKVGGRISPPEVLHSVNAEFSDGPPSEQAWLAPDDTQKSGVA